MRRFILGILLATSAVVVPATQAEESAAAAKTPYSTTETEVGTLLDDPAECAILEKHVPSITRSTQIDMVRSMTLKMHV